MSPGESPCFESPVGPEVQVDGQRLLWFGGTAYLGLQARPEVIAAAVAAIQRFGLHPGSARAGYGTTPPLLAAEAEAAEFFGTAAALHVASGWAATALLVAALPTRRWRAFHDEHAHASAREALGLLDATPRHPYAHGDAGDLAARLQRELKAGETPLVVTDGVFAGNGRLAPLAALREALAPYPGGTLLVDDAHGFGVLGENGRGSVEHAGLADDDALLVAGTASKALGGHGALVAGNAERIARIARASAWSAGSTPPTVPVAAATAAALRIARTEPQLRVRLHAHAETLRAGLRALGVTLRDDARAAPIIALSLPREREVDALHVALRRAGILVPVLKGYGGLTAPALRIAVFATHEAAHLEALLDALRRHL